MCFGPDDNQLEMRMKDTAGFNMRIFCEFFGDEMKNECSNSSDNDPCFYSIIVTSDFIQSVTAQPPIKVHLWINLEKNYDFSEEGDFKSVHHVEVYRGHAQHHRLHLRVFFFVAIILQFIFQKFSSSNLKSQLELLFSFTWLSFVSFMPETLPSPEDSVNGSVTVSTYLVIIACALCMRSAIAFTVHKTQVKNGVTFMVLTAGAGLVTALVLSISIYLSYLSINNIMFPNNASFQVFCRLMVLLWVDSVLRMGLRRLERRRNAHLFVIVVDLVCVFALFYLVPPAFLKSDSDMFRFLLIRLVEVRRPYASQNCCTAYTPAPQVLVFHNHFLASDGRLEQEESYGLAAGSASDAAELTYWARICRVFGSVSWAVFVCACAPCVVCPQLPLFSAFPDEVRALLLDINNSTIILPFCLILLWIWRNFGKLSLDGTVLVFCLSAIVCIEGFCHLRHEQFSTRIQHFLRTTQKDFFSVTLVLLWAQSRNYLEMITHRGIGRQFYSIKQTLTNFVVFAYFLFIFVMYLSPIPSLWSVVCAVFSCAPSPFLPPPPTQFAGPWLLVLLITSGLPIVRASNITYFARWNSLSITS